VTDLSAAEAFFVTALGYRVEWRPDPDNVYLTRDHDNVALHRAERPDPRRRRASPDDGARAEPEQSDALLDHLGVLVARAEDVDAWERHLDAVGARIVARPRTHRDGARSLYVAGPEGIVVQIIHHPPALA
jgi:catechol 2,3-dioxygenase-like lactoylglutathione lyase family enzyme